MCSNEQKIDLHKTAILDRLTDNGCINANAIQLCTNMSSIDDSSVDENLIATWNKLKNKPKVIVFDLDCTLWPFWIDTHVEAPFKKSVDKSEQNKFSIEDRHGRILSYYSQVPKVLNTLRYHCVKNDGFMAVASRTCMHDESISLFEMFNWRRYFDSMQMYSGCKVKHLNKIAAELGVKNKYEMLFFDDDYRNIYDTKSLGITAYELDPMKGLTVHDCIQGLQHHDQKIATLLSLKDSDADEIDYQ